MCHPCGTAYDDSGDFFLRLDTWLYTQRSTARNLLAAGFTITAILSGCGSTESEVAPDVVAVVGDVHVTGDRLGQAIDKTHGRPEQREARRSEAVARTVLDQIIGIELLLRAAENRNLDKDLKVQGRVEQRQRELLLEELFHRGIVKLGSGATTVEAKRYFDEHHIGEHRRVRRILLGSPQDATQVITRLRNGEAFAKVAVELSDDPETSAKGGDLGWLSRLYFRNYVLRRQVFSADIGQLIGPVQEPDGYSVLTVEAVRQVSFAEMEQQVLKTVAEERQSMATFQYLEELANNAALEVDEATLGILFGRLREAGAESPTLGRGEAGMQLLEHGDKSWTVGEFLEAVSARKDPIEIVDVKGLRRYARRLFAYYSLLPLRAIDLGLGDTERVRKGVRKLRREALLERLREVEVTELIEIEEEEVRKYYEEHRETYVRSAKISILEVLLDDRAQADDLLQKLEKGEKLEDLARQYTMRSSRVRRAGGRMQLMRPDKYGRVGFEASEAEIGEIVGPVRSSQGFSVFKVLKKIPGYEESFEEARPRAGWHMKQDLAVSGFDEYLTRLREKTGVVEIIEPNLATFVASRQSKSQE
jgi:peptidyl-prolyl cis-trans isomerase C